mgnify:CR=1 FL=1
MNNKEEKDMLEMKPWYQSKTVWGALIAIAAPLLGRAGLELGGAEQAETEGGKAVGRAAWKGNR